MTVPRDSSSLTLFNQTSLAIQLKPSAQPVMNLKTSQKATPGHAGMRIRTRAAQQIPATMHALSPRREMAVG